MKFERKLKVNKTGAYQLGVSHWADGEPLAASSVTSDGKCTIVSQSHVDSVISFTATGVTVGLSEIHFEFSTSSTSDCYVAQIEITEDC